MWQRRGAWWRGAALGLVLSGLGAGCSSCEDKRPDAADAADEPEERDAHADAALADALDAAAPDAALADADVDADTDDAGTPTGAAPIALTEGKCRPAWGPVRLPYRGPGALRGKDGRLEVIFHHHGQLLAHRARYGKPPAAGAVVPTQPEQQGSIAASFPGCVIARTAQEQEAALYCVGDEGAVTRMDWLGKSQHVVGQGARSELLAAAAFDEAHTVVAYLGRRQVAGELALEAYAALGDQPPLRISDDGSGATFVTLRALNATTLVALSVDARLAMSPVHARLLHLEHGKLKLGADEVIYVGGGTQGGHGAIARFADEVDAFGHTRAATVALLPLPHESGFGAVGLPLPMPLQTDLQGQVYDYPREIDAARVATARVGKRVYAALVRTRNAERNGPKALELAELKVTGKLEPLGLVAEGAAMLDLDLWADEFGALWLLYGDHRGSVLERRVCP